MIAISGSEHVRNSPPHAFIYYLLVLSPVINKVSGDSAGTLHASFCPVYLEKLTMSFKSLGKFEQILSIFDLDL